MGNPLHYKRYTFPSLHFVSLGSLVVSFLHSLISSLIPFGHSVDRRFVYSVIPLYLLSIFSFYLHLYRYVYTSLFIYRFVQSPSLHIPFHYTCSLRVSHFTYGKLLSYTHFLCVPLFTTLMFRSFLTTQRYTNLSVRANKKPTIFMTIGLVF